MAKVTEKTLMGALLARDINCAEILIEAGMHCIGCPSAAGESLEQACMVHGIDCDILVAKLNEYFGE